MPLDMVKTTCPEVDTRIHVLIVEKHGAVRRALRKRLDATPQLAVIAAVSDPAQALSYCVAGAGSEPLAVVPDVVLLGLQNGSDEELFRNLDLVRQLTQFATSVIVLAPYADEGERLLLQQAGARRYLLKHIDSYRLIEEIEDAVRKDRCS